MIGGKHTAEVDQKVSGLLAVGSAVLGTLAVSELEPAGYALPASFVPDPWVSGAQDADSVWAASYGPTLTGLARGLEGGR